MFHNFRMSKDFHLAPGVNPHSPHEENFMNLTPDAVLGLQYWFKADDGLILSGSDVTTWEDKSSNGWDAIDESPTDVPSVLLAELNGLDVVSFDDNFLRSVDTTTVFDGKSGATYLAVWKLRSVVVSGAKRAWDVQQSNDGFSMFVDTDTGPRVSTNAGILVADDTSVTGAWEIATARFDSSDSSLTYYRNGSVIVIDTGTGTSTSTIISNGRICIGSIQAIPGLGPDFALAELIIYNETISESDRLGLENYLANKWGL